MTVKKALFLDRDGVVNKVVRKYSGFHKEIIDDSPFNLSELRFNEGIKSLVDFARAQGYKIIIVTNQPSILKGDSSMKNYEEITTKICEELGLSRSDVFECFHKEGLCLECNCRKPKPGLFFMAKAIHKINFKKSIMVGDSCKDMLAAKSAQIGKTIYLKRIKNEFQTGNAIDEKIMIKQNIHPDRICGSLIEIINEL